MLYAIARRVDQRTHVLHDHSLRVFVASHEIRITPHSHRKLEARFGRILASRADHEIIHPNTRSLLKRDAEDPAIIAKLRGGIADQ